MPHFARHYTIEEANALLPEVREQLAQIRALREELGEEWKRAAPVLKAAPYNGGGAEAAGYLDSLRRLHACLRWFAEREILLKDLERGLVDFPALRGDEEVLLCWEDSEDQVAYWHDFETGYAGRRRWEG